MVYRIAHADRPGFEDHYKHSATILKGILQPTSNTLHLNARVAGRGHADQRAAKPKLLSLFQTHERHG